MLVNIFKVYFSPYWVYLIKTDKLGINRLFNKSLWKRKTRTHIILEKKLSKLGYADDIYGFKLKEIKKFEKLFWPK